MSSREAFEKWVSEAGLPTVVSLDGAYWSFPVGHMWEGWKAATERAALVCAAMGNASGVEYAGQGCLIAASTIREGND